MFRQHIFLVSLLFSLCVATETKSSFYCFQTNTMEKLPNDALFLSFYNFAHYPFFFPICVDKTNGTIIADLQNPLNVNGVQNITIVPNGNPNLNGYCSYIFLDNEIYLTWNRDASNYFFKFCLSTNDHFLLADVYPSEGKVVNYELYIDKEFDS